MLLKPFIEQLQKIYDEAKGSGHTKKYPPEVDFIIDYEGDFIDDAEIVDIEISTSHAACCGDIIGANIIIRMKDDEKDDRTA